MIRIPKNSWPALALVALGLMGFVSGAMAQNAASVDQVLALRNTDVPNDLSKFMWNQIFGGFFWNPFTIGTPSTLLGNALIVFNTAVFAVGVAWLSYGILSGVVGTAQDGQALGQRINSAWYPIRVVTGIVGMTPVLGGFTLSQGLLMWIAGLSIGIANTIYISAVQNMNMGLFHSAAVTASPKINSANDVVIPLLQSNLCMGEHMIQEQIQSQSGAPLDASQLVRSSIVSGREGDNPSMTIRFGSQAEPSKCGSVTIKQDSSGLRTNTSMLAFRVNSVDYGGVAAAIFNSQRANLKAINGTIQESSIRLIEAVYRDEPLEVSFRQVDEAVADLKGKINQSTMTALQSAGTEAVTAQAKANMLAYGWMSLGSWFSTFAEVNAGLTTAANSVSVNYQKPTSTNTSVNETVDKVMDKYRDYLAASGKSGDSPKGGIDAAIKETCDGILPDKMAGTATGNCSIGQNIVGLLISGASADSGGGATATGTLTVGNGAMRLVNPIIGLKNVGDYMLTLSSGVIFARPILNVASDVMKVASSIPGVGSASKALSGALSGSKDESGSQSTALGMIGVIFFAAAAYMSIYVPLVPFVVWIGALVAYAASFIEGLLAMPLHSLSHLDTDGEGMGQRTGHGYLFFLNTLARAPLMVIAFLVASALVIGLGTMVTMMYMPAIANAQGNSITGIISIFGYLIVYGVIMSIVINACFDLCQIIPDQVIGFVGAGSVSTTLGRDAEQKINTMFMGAARLGPSALGKGDRSMIDQMARKGMKKE